MPQEEYSDAKTRQFPARRRREFGRRCVRQRSQSAVSDRADGSSSTPPRRTPEFASFASAKAAAWARAPPSRHRGPLVTRQSSRRGPLLYSIAVPVSFKFQFTPGSATSPAPIRVALAILAFALLWLSPAVARAQDAPPGAVGRVQGKDISVENGTAANNGTARSAPSIYVLNGSVVTVHSAKARMTIFTGGKVDICGPAKFTVLLSGDAITLALNFGRVRVSLPAKTTLRIFTPTIIGTPIDISGGSRDVTVGLNLDDSLCVLATSGAIQLENQFSDEKLIVPQAGEFFLNAGRLLPVAGTPGSCQCFADDAPPTPRPPGPIPETETATATPPPIAPPNAIAPAAEPPAKAKPAVEPHIEYSLLAHANEDHPMERPVDDPVPSPPPVSMPVYTVVLPPLVFSAS